MKNFPHFFHLSGIHSKLPSYEIISILESEYESSHILEERKQCLIVNCSSRGAQIAAQRASYCKRVVKLLFQGENDIHSATQIAKKISENVDFKQFVSKDDTYLVRVYSIGVSEISTLELETKLGREIWLQLDNRNKVSMKNPDRTFVVLFSDNEYLFGIELSYQKRGLFINRRPDIRPYFKPGTLDPRFARLMVNLSMVNKEKYLLDPFCGPGGILIEGALMNCKVIGIDIDRKMIIGSNKNLQYFTPKADFELIIGDARNLPFNKTIDSIATDPPYGRSTSTHGREIEILLEQFFEQAAMSLKTNGCLAIGIFEEIPIKELANDSNFDIKIYEKLYIHKSLTRKVGVFLKK